MVQIDEPYLQARPEKARSYGVEVINRALEGIEGPTALHLCFGYAAIVHDRPPQYSFLTELRDCVARQISIEAAQPHLDLSVLRQFANKTIIVGVLNLGDMEVETPETVAGRIRSALQYVEPERSVGKVDAPNQQSVASSLDGLSGYSDRTRGHPPAGAAVRQGIVRRVPAFKRGSRGLSRVPLSAFLYMFYQISEGIALFKGERFEIRNLIVSRSIYVYFI